MTGTWDYIIIGGGSAGSVVAYRLSERRDMRILVLEAGERDLSPFIRIPIRRLPDEPQVRLGLPRRTRSLP